MPIMNNAAVNIHAQVSLDVFISLECTPRILRNYQMFFPKQLHQFAFPPAEEGNTFFHLMKQNNIKTIGSS